MNIQAIQTKIFKPGDSLLECLDLALPTLSEKSIVVITSKIVALSQNRVVADAPGEKERLIKQESEQLLETEWCYLTLKDGHWCPNAGIDDSNADGQLILWPEKPYEVAGNIRTALQKKFNLKELGVLITDSRIFPLRAGVTGVALGYAGFKGLRNYVGEPDIFGKPLTMTQTNIADGLATAAVIEMGEGREQTPLALITDARVEFLDTVDPEELRMDPKNDLYRPLFENK